METHVSRALDERDGRKEGRKEGRKYIRSSGRAEVLLMHVLLVTHELT